MIRTAIALRTTLRAHAATLRTTLRAALTGRKSAISYQARSVSRARAQSSHGTTSPMGARAALSWYQARMSEPAMATMAMAMGYATDRSR